MNLKTILYVSLLCLATLTNAQSKVIAHRGYWATANGAHNSLSSLYRAADIAAYGTEFDVWMTADGQLVVFHDDKIGGLQISSSTYAEIRDMKIANGEVLPTLDNFLVFAKNFPDLRLVLEIKSNIGDQDYAAHLVKAIVEKVEDYQLGNRTDYIAFSLQVCSELAKIRPEANIAYLMGNKEPEELKSLGINGIDYHHSVFLAYPDLVKRAHDVGLTVNAWTVNDADTMRKLIGMGVDFITTDQPELLQRILVECSMK